VSTKKVLSLGQCAADHASIGGLLRRQLDAEVDAADTFADAEARLNGSRYDLILVNRVLDRDGTEGLEFIARIKAHPEWRQFPVMLVSNYQDAQEQAIARGALPGFGKASLGSTKTISRLRAVLGVDGESDQPTQP
jgi:two-component system chemotaxis response regulator CheY